LKRIHNIYLGKIEAELKRAFLEGMGRLMERDREKAGLMEIETFYAPKSRVKLIKSLRDPAYNPEWKKTS